MFISVKNYEIIYLENLVIPILRNIYFFLNKKLNTMQAVMVNRKNAILLYCFNNYLLRPTFITRRKPFINFELWENRCESLTEGTIVT